MKITFVGSSHGVPAADRYCSCAMIEVGEAIYFIDAGAPVMDELLRMGKDINKVRAVFTTHSHSDHVDGILSMSGLVSWYYKQASVYFYLTEQELIDAFKNLLLSTVGALNEERAKFRLMDADFIYEDENIRVSLIPTAHLKDLGRPSYAILVECEGKRVLFSGDLSNKLAHADLPSIVSEEELDVLICEMAHFGPEHIAPYLESCRSKAVYFTHVYPLSKLDAIKEMNGKHPFPVYIVNDRDEIEL